MFYNKKKSVSCPPQVFFDIIKQDLELRICCDIHFIWNNKRHAIGAWGDDGETVQNVRFYFDKLRFNSLEELMEGARLDDIPLLQFSDNVVVTECDSCYPEATPLLKQYKK